MSDAPDFFNDHSERYLEMAFCADYLETLPESSHPRAEPACGALYRALADLRRNIRDPRKKNYIFK